VKQKVEEFTNINSRSDVLLIISPPYNVESPSLSLAHLNAYLKQNEIFTSIFDINIKLFNMVPAKYYYLWTMNYSHLWQHGESFRQISEVLRPYLATLIYEIITHPAKAFIFHLSTNNSGLILRTILENVKREVPSKIIIIEGAVLCIKEKRNSMLSMLRDYVDYCIVGAGEEALCEIGRSIFKNNEDKIKNIPGVLGKETFFQPIKPRAIENLDILPYVTFDAFSLDEYHIPSSLPLAFSRSDIEYCPLYDYEIHYPYIPQSASSIVNQIKLYKEHYNIDHVNIADVAINKNMRLLEEVCDLLIQENFSIAIKAQAVPCKEVNDRILRKMMHAGFYRLEYSIESGSNKILKEIRKTFTVEEAEDAIRSTHKEGLETYVTITVGYPGERDSEFEATKNFLRKNASFITLISVHPFSAIVGTQWYQNHERYGIVLPEEDYDTNWSIPRDNNTQDV